MNSSIFGIEYKNACFPAIESLELQISLNSTSQHQDSYV